MAQFNYLNELKTAGARLDGPLTRGPLQRWVRRDAENLDPDCSTAAANRSLKNLSLSSSNNTSTLRATTPTRGEHKKKKTPSKNKSPGRSTTPTPNKSHTPNEADRFIPSRTNSNYDLCHYMMSRDAGAEEAAAAGAEEGSRAALGRALAEAAPAEGGNEGRLLQYTCKAPAAPEGYQNRLRVIYSQAKAPSSVKSSTRYIPQAPDRILDAPDIVDDYYLNLVDWSASNLVAVALGAAVYLWDAGSGHIEQLLQLDAGDAVCSLSWAQAGAHLAVGTASAAVQLWDCARAKRLRVMDGHSGRVGALAWNAYVLSSGGRDGRIVHHDVRQREHALASVGAHSQEVCGLRWSPDGRLLASGGNDNLLHVWSAAQGEHYSQPPALYTFNQHQAAVKGLAWCPWSGGILASGGGTADRTLRLWNTNTGANINTVDTKSQVCSILWSTHYKELITGHGYANNQLVIWKYPLLARVAELTGHTARVLHLALSPDGSTVLSAGADETLRLWKCFMPDPSRKKESADHKSAKSVLNMNSLLR